MHDVELAELNWPAGQFAQDVLASAREYFPAAQTVHDVIAVRENPLPSTLYVPGGHGKQSDSDVEPVITPYRPARQKEHD
jgi:hypothetical protein